MEILRKLQIKDDSIPKLIINGEKEYLNSLRDNNVPFDEAVKNDSYPFIQIFGISNEDLKNNAEKYLPLLNKDGLFWLCYPKKSTKKYHSDCERERVAMMLINHDYEPVRQIAIDDDFSALRFRHVDNIKNMTRKIAYSEEGKKRVEENDKCGG